MRIKIFNSFIVFLLSFFIFREYSYAQYINIAGKYNICSTDFQGCLVAINRDLNTFIIAIAVLITIFILPYVGLLFASGDPGKIEKAKEILEGLIGGFLLVAFSGIIILIVLTELLGVG